MSLTAPHKTIHSYVDDGIFQLKSFANKYKEDGLKDLNEICGAHVLELDLLEDSSKFTYCGGIVRDGKLVIVFNEKNFGVNTNHALETNTVLAALNEAPPAEGNPSKLSFRARLSIRSDWDPKIEAVRAKVAELLENPDIKFEPNWDDTFAKLAAESKRKGTTLAADWEASLGSVVYWYFEGVKSTLEYKKFGSDEMLREGFNEAVEKSLIALRIVDALKDSSYCEVVIDDGTLFIQVRRLPPFFSFSFFFA